MVDDRLVTSKVRSVVAPIVRDPALGAHAGPRYANDRLLISHPFSQNTRLILDVARSHNVVVAGDIIIVDGGRRKRRWIGRSFEW